MTTRTPTIKNNEIIQIKDKTKDKKKKKKTPEKNNPR